MAILPDQIEKPEFVWASLDETLEQVRERLESPEIDNKWRAFVFVRSQKGTYAATSVFDLQQSVWEAGPPALKRRLRDLGLFHLHPGVDADSVNLAEAQRLASQHGGYVVIVRGKQVEGLVRRPGRFRLPLKPPDAFDLFDELIPKAVLDKVEFVEATPNTTVAKVAADLKSLGAPDQAYVVVDMGDGSFQVMSTHDLSLEVDKGDPQIWTFPIHYFESKLRLAETREIDTIGYKQAQALADRSHFLVLTDQGQPRGLLLSSVIWRSAELRDMVPYDVAKGPYGLYNAPETFLEGLPAEVEQEQEPRYVNLWFEDAKKGTLDPSEALVLDQLYHLALNVGRLLPHSIIDWERRPGGPMALVEPGEETYLYISVHSQDFYIPEPTQALWLPKAGDTQVLHIPVQPLRFGRGQDRAKLEICLYYRAFLVQTFEIRAEVVAAGEKALSDQPQSAELTHERTKGFPDMALLPPRELSLTISREGIDRYAFTFLLDPDPEDKAAAQRAIELSCPVRMTRDDLTHLITKARRQFYNVVRRFDKLQEQDEATYRRATRALAQVGRQLYLKLFDDGPARTLADWMEKSLPDGSTIQIVDLAGDFVFPWSLVYTEPPWDDDKPLDATRFWGWRYKLVILTGDMLDTYRQASPALDVDDSLRLSVGMYQRLKGIQKQNEFFDTLDEQTPFQVTPEILTQQRKMSQALAEANRDIYYFFCHGFTEKIATDIQLDADLVSAFTLMSAERLGAQSESVRDHREDLFDVSDSWLRLTRGRIPLTKLKETVPDEFSKHPFVFLNMCESAQVLPSLSDGFVPFFIRRGARAVIGTECSMNTLFADDFSRAFLTRFFQGEPVGDILLALRRAYLEAKNPLALAYTLYADADLHLDLQPAGREQAPQPD